MQVCNVLYQPHLYFLFFGVIISNCQLLKFTEKTHKIAQNCIQNDQKLSAGVEEVGVAEKGGRVRRENWREERHGCWGIDAPDCRHNFIKYWPIFKILPVSQSAGNLQ